jgi:hypothetical protein
MTVIARIFHHVDFGRIEVAGAFAIDADMDPPDGRSRFSP